MHLVHPVLLTKLVKTREKFRKELHNLSRIFHVFAESCESNHVSEQEGLVIELINLSFLVLDNSQNMEGHKLANKNTDIVNLDVENPLIVKTFPLDHFSVVNTYG